jgi:hypothetical protein
VSRRDAEGFRRAKGTALLPAVRQPPRCWRRWGHRPAMDHGLTGPSTTFSSTWSTRGGRCHLGRVPGAIGGQTSSMARVIETNRGCECGDEWVQVPGRHSNHSDQLARLATSPKLVPRGSKMVKSPNPTTSASSPARFRDRRDRQGLSSRSYRRRARRLLHGTYADRQPCISERRGVPRRFTCCKVTVSNKRSSSTDKGEYFESVRIFIPYR